MFEEIEHRGMVLLGCGKMGSALLAGWLREGLSPNSVWVIEPNPSDWLSGTGVNLNKGMPDAPKIALIAVKPQMMGEALPSLKALATGSTTFVSIAAGTPISAFQTIFGESSPIIRAMPNTPAAIGKGITALIGNAQVSTSDLDLAEALLSSVGKVIRLEDENQMDAVTAVSGSGPAYVFHLIETLAAAAEAEGLSPEMAMQLAKATVDGAGSLATQSDESPGQLRVNVTSPGGTTAAALAVLMDENSGFPPLLRAGVKAAADRSRELANG